MRKWNARISVLIMVLFLIHGIAGGFQLMGLIPGGQPIFHVISVLMVILILIHAGIGCKLTVDTIRICRKTGVSYFRENALFWTRRISGVALMILVLFHILLFWENGGEVLRLSLFEGPQLAANLLMAASLAVHILCNIRPLMVSLGKEGRHVSVRDIMLILAAVLLFCTIGFVIYYLRWNVFWKYR